jgi:hypothetical protein
VRGAALYAVYLLQQHMRHLLAALVMRCRRGRARFLCSAGGARAGGRAGMWGVRAAFMTQHFRYEVSHRSQQVLVCGSAPLVVHADVRPSCRHADAWRPHQNPPLRSIPVRASQEAQCSHVARARIGQPCRCLVSCDAGFPRSVGSPCVLGVPHAPWRSTV